MLVLLFFAFISGLATILAPCIWPLLPIVLSATATGGHRKPLGITLGITTSFAVFTLSLSYILRIISFDPNILRLLAAVVITFLGLTLLIPKLSAILEGFVSKLSNKISSSPTPGVRQLQTSGFISGFITGFSLGIVWSPCAGPILATIATLAATQTVNFSIILVTISYVLGVGIPLFIFAIIGRTIFTKSRFLSAYTGRIQQIFGIIMIITAIAIYTNYDKVISAKLLNTFPACVNYLVSLESNPLIQKQLNNIKNNSDSIPQYGSAPDFTGITNWLNSPDGEAGTNKPLTMADLKGKVVLIDFWTYTCINCLRTLPHITSWFDKYHDKGFVVVGVHTPEFEFEKNTQNVETAIKQFKIHYPVAQDNNYATWQSYNNQYWPAEYLIDAKGVIRHYNFGEGYYDQTEKLIQQLLAENGQKAETPVSEAIDQTPKHQLTPETYLGLKRREGFGDNWTLKGDWDIQDEYIASKSNSSLDFKFNAGKVYLVLTPATSSDIVKVSLDEKLTQTITANVAKLYTLVELPEVGSHLLHLDFQNPGTKIYAFTFGD